MRSSAIYELARRGLTGRFGKERPLEFSTHLTSSVSRSLGSFSTAEEEEETVCGVVSRRKSVRLEQSGRKVVLQFQFQSALDLGPRSARDRSEFAISDR